MPEKRHRAPAPAASAAAAAPTVEPRPSQGLFAGLTLVALATLLAELTLTRVFSVVFWYHYAFVAVSIALFGMTVGAVIVHLLPRGVKERRSYQVLALAAIAFGITLMLATWSLVAQPWRPPRPGDPLSALAGLYLIVSVPFVFSGVAVSLALTGSPSRVNRLYAADLVGAAMGCLVMAALVRALGGPGALMAGGVLAAGAGAAFSLGAGRLCRLAALLTLLGVAGITAAGVAGHWFQVYYAKGMLAEKPEFEGWNAFSRVVVWDMGYSPPIDWGGSLGRPPAGVDQKNLFIDGCASTAITRFDGNLEDVAFFRSDITALAHRLRGDGSALVIGAGGGRDVLIALTSGQREVTAVELNDLILQAVNQKFGDFTGHLDRQPGVRFVNDEARSYLARSHDRYDVIACSLIDTWAATAAGAFVFSENGLYTVEAWRTFLDRLQPDGVLAVTRWYYGPQPAEVWRLLVLAREVLTTHYGWDPMDHVIVAKRVPPGPLQWGVGTVLVSRKPFSKADAATAAAFCQENGFELELAPGKTDNLFADILRRGPQALTDTGLEYLDLSPPTDDRPFFFHMLRPGAPAELAAQDRSPIYFNMEAMRLLGRLLALTALLTLVFIVLPLALGAVGKQYDHRGALPLLGYFAAIGLGFMLVEISQMQRLMIYLGHPIYGVAVVLFSLLLASGLGSLASNVAASRLGTGRVMLLLLLVLALFALVTPHLTAAARAWPALARLALAVGTLLPMGFLMGMPFPLGMTAAGRKPRAPLAWLWGANGATSVLASVLAMAFSLYYGVTLTYLLGFACYAGATGCLVAVERRKAA